MNADEKAIFDYLKACPRTYISGREIARKVYGKEHFEEDRYWAVPLLAAMVNKNWLETDCAGCFRIKSDERKKNKLQRHISPQIVRILKSSGKNFDSIILDAGDDETSLSSAPKPITPKPSTTGGQSSR